MEKTYKFELPQNREVESTNVRIKDGKVFVNVEFKERFQPEDGDFLVSSYGKVFIYREERAIDKLVYGCYCGVNRLDIIHTELSNNWTQKAGCRFATSAEKGVFLAQLEKECNKRWNAEKKCLEDIYVPKFGDIVRIDHPNIHLYKRRYVISIFPNKEVPNKSVSGFFDICGIDMNGILLLEMNAYYNNGYVTAASESEKKELFDKLAEVGKRWNPETNKLENVRWRAKHGNKFFVVSDLLEVLCYKDYRGSTDNTFYKLGNYFRTPESAQKVADQIKEIFKNSEV